MIATIWLILAIFNVCCIIYATRENERFDKNDLIIMALSVILSPLLSPMFLIVVILYYLNKILNNGVRNPFYKGRLKKIVNTSFEKVKN